MNDFKLTFDTQSCTWDLTGLSPNQMRHIRQALRLALHEATLLTRIKRETFQEVKDVPIKKLEEFGIENYPFGRREDLMAFYTERNIFVMEFTENLTPDGIRELSHHACDHLAGTIKAAISEAKVYSHFPATSIRKGISHVNSIFRSHGLKEWTEYDEILDQDLQNHFMERLEMLTCIAEALEGEYFKEGQP